MNDKCQVFTPSDIAYAMLDIAEYKTNLFNKKVLEAACGEGNILLCIARRYIDDCILNNLELSVIKNGLENDIWAFDYDFNCCLKCVENLDILAYEYGISDVSWNVNNCDALMTSPRTKFDYIIGNPPYITYRDLTADNRSRLKSLYKACSKGAFDYCYAFIEHDIDFLSENGKMVYLIPSSIFKNVHANVLREKMLPSISKIFDYTSQKLFGSVLISSAIILFDNSTKNANVSYYDIVAKCELLIPKNQLLSGKWVFEQLADENRQLVKEPLINRS